MLTTRVAAEVTTWRFRTQELPGAAPGKEAALRSEDGWTWVIVRNFHAAALAIGLDCGGAGKKPVLEIL